MTETIMASPVMLAALASAPLWAVLLMGGIVIALLVLLHKELWEFFVRLEVGIILLIVLTILSLVGGLLPQHLTEAAVAEEILEIQTPATVEIDEAAEKMGLPSPAGVTPDQAASLLTDIPPVTTITEEEAVKHMGTSIPEGVSVQQAYGQWVISEYAVSILENYHSWFQDKVNQLQQPQKFFYKYGFFMIYHTWYFLLLAYLLFLNVVCCSIKRVVTYFRMQKRDPAAFSEEMLMNQNEVEQFDPDGAIISDADKAIEALAADGLNARKCKKEASGYQLSLDSGFKMPHTLTSVFYHLALFIGLIGLLNTSYYKWEDYIELSLDEVAEINLFSEDAKAYEVLQSWHRNHGWEWANPEKHFDLEETFEVRCDDYWTEYIPHGEDWYGVKDYVSILSIIDDGKEVVTEQHVEVNFPLIYKGIDFFQTGVTLVGDLIITPPSGEPIKVQSTIWGTQIPQIPGLNTFLAGSSYISGKLRNEDGSLTDFGPMIRIGEVVPEEVKNWPHPPTEKPKMSMMRRQEVDWQFVVEAGTPTEWKGYTFELTEPYMLSTGLQVVRDPGVPILWVSVFGILIMMVLRVYFPIYRTRIDVTPTTSGEKLVIAGRTYGLSANFRKQAARIQNILKSTGK